MESTSSDATSPIKIWLMLRRRWRVIAMALFSCIGLGLVWLVQVTPLYTASTQVLLDTRKHKTLPGTEVVSDSSFDANSIATEVALVRSYAVASRVVEKLRLANSSEFMGTRRGSGIFAVLYGAVSGLLSTSRTTKPEAPPEEEQRLSPGTLPLDGAALDTTAKVEPPVSEEEQARRVQSAIATVQNGLAVRRMATTFFLSISYTHRSPRMAAAVANAVSDAYLNEVLEARYQSQQRSARWLSERVVTVRLQVQAAERAVSEFRAENNLVTARPGSLSEQQANEINAQLVSARAQSVEKKNKFEQAKGILESGRIDSMAEVMGSPVIVTLRNQDAVIAREEADLLTRYGPEHPSIVKIRAQRSDLRRQVSAEVARVVASLKTDYDLARTREQSLQSSLEELQSDSSVMIRLRELEREANASKVLYEALLARTKEAEQQSNAPSAESRVIAPAMAPGQPSYPNRQNILLMALLGGLALGVGLAFLLDYIESGFLTMEQVEQTLQLPVLAMVQQLDPKEMLAAGPDLSIPEYVWRKPMSQFGEAIRSARVAAQMADIDNPPRVILVTSALPSEGKTTMSQCLAFSAAASGRVLIMDCDFRHPSMSKFFNLTEGPGLTDLLLDQAQPRDVLVAGPIPNLTIIPAGSFARNPPDILASDKLAGLLDILRKEYDQVIIDAPPISPVIDAALLSKRVDKVIFVVHWRTTPQDIVVRSLAAIDRAHHKVAGVILNGVELQKLTGYNRYYQYYGKGYDKYYSSR